MATPEEAAALGVTKAATSSAASVYKTLAAALERGLLAEQDIDVALRRLMLARFKLGMFDPPERVPYAQIPYTRERRARARPPGPAHGPGVDRAAQERRAPAACGRTSKTIAVVGPERRRAHHAARATTTARPTKPGDGPGGDPQRGVARARRSSTPAGVDLVEGRQDPRALPAIDSAYLRPAADATERGLRGEYFKGTELQGEPVLTRVDPTVDFRWDRALAHRRTWWRAARCRAERRCASDDFSMRWTGQLAAAGLGRLRADGHRRRRRAPPRRRPPRHRGVDDDAASPARRAASVKLEAGRAYDLRLEYFEAIRDAEVRLAWRLPGAGTPFEEALEAARAADVVVFVGGLTGEVEGEEMKVSYPGFAGGDRTDIALPAHAGEAAARRCTRPASRSCSC